jgi:hypothetical protein
MTNGKTLLKICDQVGTSDKSYYRWHKKYCGGLKVDQVKRFKEIESPEYPARWTLCDISCSRCVCPMKSSYLQESHIYCHVITSLKPYKLNAMTLMHKSCSRKRSSGSFGFFTNCFGCQFHCVLFEF